MKKFNSYSAFGLCFSRENKPLGHGINQALMLGPIVERTLTKTDDAEVTSDIF